MIARLKAQHPAPTLLVIGGGAIGAGAEELYAAPNVRVVGRDVYASSNTQVVADGHFLPFRDGVFDGVWIQAVLEHVLDPPALVAEIHRVLKPSGLVYADTPFMQQVHEQAYDFTRFTRAATVGFSVISRKSTPARWAARARRWSGRSVTSRSRWA